MNLFNQTQEQKTANKIKKCISSKSNAFDKLREKMIQELTNNNIKTKNSDMINTAHTGTPEQIQEFTIYFNKFYGVEGLYPVKDVTEEEIKHHIEFIRQAFPKYKFEGDSFDREEIRDLMFTKEELKKAYKQ